MFRPPKVRFLPEWSSLASLLSSEKCLPHEYGRPVLGATPDRRPFATLTLRDQSVT